MAVGSSFGMVAGTGETDGATVSTDVDMLGGDACPSKLRPQQATVPSSLIPQVCPEPALTEVNEPEPDVDWPSWSEPQQTMEPLALTPQLCPPPDSTIPKAPEGESVWPSSLKPQQTTEPSTRVAQLCQSPLLTVVNGPAGGLA